MSAAAPPPSPSPDEASSSPTCSSPRHGLSESEREAFARDGLLFPLRVLPSSEAATLCAAALEAMEEGEGTPYQPVECALVRNEMILDIVQDVLGTEDLLCWESTVWIKMPGSHTHVSWHQDARYWGLDPAEDVVTMWVALSDVPKQAGPVLLIPGTHTAAPRGGFLRHVEKGKDKAVGNLLSRGQEIVSEELDLALVQHAVLEPGEALLFHSKTAHSSGIMDASHPYPRVGVSIRYMPPSVRQPICPGGLKDEALLARGTDTHGHYLLHDAAPVEADGVIVDPELLKVSFDRMLRTRDAILLHGAATAK